MMIDIKCETCSSIFKTLPHEAKRGRKYCSRECYNKTKGGNFGKVIELYERVLQKS